MRASLYQGSGSLLPCGPGDCLQRSTGAAPRSMNKALAHASSTSRSAAPTPSYTRCTCASARCPCCGALSHAQRASVLCCAAPSTQGGAPLVPDSPLHQQGRHTAGAARRTGVVCRGFFNFNLGGRGGGKDKEQAEARARQERERREKEEREQTEGSNDEEDEDEEDRKAAATLASILRASLGLESDDTPRPNEVERSEMVNEEMVYFIFQMDLDVQLQRALNYEAYEFAQGVRAKRQRVDEALNEMMQRKAENVGGGEAAAAVMSSSELAEEGLKLRAQMQKAVEEERYSDAARIRDTLADLERRSKKAEALAAEFTPTGAQRQFRLGQRVKHRKFGYRGVVVGWDAQCCESDEWARAVGVAELPRGPKQPFYQLLVDVRDWTFNYTLPPVAYAAEDLLWAPEMGGPEGMEVYEAQSTASSRSSSSSPEPEGSQSSSKGASIGKKDKPQLGDPMSWVERFGEGGLRHPYEYMLFLGQDARGDYLPCKQLRDRYNVQRRDVWAPGQDGEEDDDEDGSGPGDFFSPPD